MIKSKNIYVTRHGTAPAQTPEWSRAVDESFDGPEWDSPLSYFGRLQADALANRMKNIPLDYIFCSPFQRTIDTALPIARIKNMPLKIEWGLAEVMIEGRFDGKFPVLPSTPELHQKYPEIDPDYVSQHIPTYPEVRATDLPRRMETIVTELAENFGPNIMLITHAGPYRGVRSTLMNQPDGFNSHNASLTQLFYNGKSWDLVLDDDVSHLMGHTLYAAEHNPAK